jgi:hypothetical protein
VGGFFSSNSQAGSVARRSCFLVKECVMSKRIHAWMLLPLCGLSLVASAAPEGEGKSKTFKVKATEQASATTIDFRQQYGLPFESLTAIGARIEQSRCSADPVGLAAAANELSAAEQVSGKKASLTADALRKEAIELAKLRDESQELKAVSMLAPMAGDELTKLALAAATRERDELAAAKEGAQPKGIHEALDVHNHSEVHVHVYMNGRLLGHIEPYGQGHYHVHAHGHVTLDARGPGGHRWHEHIHEDVDTYVFELND